MRVFIMGSLAPGRFQFQKATVVMAGFGLPPFGGVPFECPSQPGHHRQPVHNNDMPWSLGYNI